MARSTGCRSESTSIPDLRRFHGPNLFAAVYATAPSKLLGENSRVRDDQGLGDDHARVFWRMHVLLDYRSSGANHSVAGKENILAEIREMSRDPDFKGIVSDVGGPTANMYQMRCSKPEVEAVCRRQSCVHPTICKLLGTNHGPLVELMKESRTQPGIKKVLIASGIRMDLARRSPKYMAELARHHVGGRLKVAPEHTDADVLERMRKPGPEEFVEFAKRFKEESKKANKKQFLVPYYIASHPGSDLAAMIDLAIFLKRNGYKPDQVQDFIPAPMDVATAIYHSGIDPFTKKPVYVAKKMRERKFQRALMQFFKPENYFEVRDALIEAGRRELIGDGCDCLIPSKPPGEALLRRREDANTRFRGDYVHTIPPADQKENAPKKIPSLRSGAWVSSWTQERQATGTTAGMTPCQYPHTPETKLQTVSLLRTLLLFSANPFK